MGVYLNPGNGMFQEAVQSEIYVDKTELIKYTNKAIGTSQKNICISRPRRFGKSMTASMLVAYYDESCDSSKLFDKFKIAKDEDYQKHLNKYSVIALNIQNFLSLMPDVKDMLALLQRRVLAELKKAYPDCVTEGECFLSLALDDIYSKTKEKFIFVIDEWDCLLREKKENTREQKVYLDFIRNLLKDKPYVALAYMTGILPIKKYGSHSALNMFFEYSMTNPNMFEEYVGFTETEVLELCSEYKMDLEEMMNWYDGYSFETVPHVYNPKSVVEAIIRKQFGSYWTRTETYEALKCYIDMNLNGLKDAITCMLGGETIKIDPETFQNDMTTFETKDDVLTLLVHLGYLAFDKKTSSVFIPNREVRGEFVRAINGVNWASVAKAIEDSEKLLKATLAMDEKAVEEMLDIVHAENTSILTYNDENSLSCVITLAYYSAMNEYTIVRELPSGKGFADIVFIPKKKSDKPALVVELKYNKTAESAIKQIKDKRYTEKLKEYEGNMLLVGINYDDKKKHQCIIEKC